MKTVTTKSDLIGRLNSCDQTYQDVYAEIQRLRDLCHEAAKELEIMEDTMMAMSDSLGVMANE